MIVASVCKGLAVWACLSPVNVASVEPTPTIVNQQPTVEPDALVNRIRPESRLRKLHLVRPDLIPYPIAHETYC